MENKRSLSVRGSLITLNEDNIILVTGPADVDGAYAHEIIEACISLAGQVEGKVDLLVDVSQSKNQNPEARLEWKRWSEHPKAGRVALHGFSPVARIVVAFGVSWFGNEQQKKAKFFTTRADALAWLLKNPACE
jgi:hypothetical protein